MKVLPFTILYPNERSIVVEHICDTHFYPHLHRHDEVQVTWIVKGKGILFSGNNMHNFHPGDIFVIGANVPHLLKSDVDHFSTTDTGKVEAYSMYFNLKSGIGALFDLPEMKEGRNVFKQYNNGFKLSGKPAIKIANTIKKIYKASNEKVLSSFIDLIKEFRYIDQLEALCSIGYSPNMTENENAQLSKVINYIMQYYHKPITLEEVSDQAFMCSGAFCRYFKRHTGRNFVSFLNEVRINEVCKNLASGKKADYIANVAYKAGFKSMTNFNRVFKNVVGISPRAYEERYRSLSQTS